VFKEKKIICPWFLHISAFGKSSTEYPQGNILPSSYAQAGDQRPVADYQLTLLF